MTDKKMKIAVFASGNGTNFQAIYDDISLGIIKGTIEIIITDNPSAGILKRAKDAGIPTHIIDKTNSKEKQLENLQRILNDKQIELIILAGYLKLVQRDIIREYKNKIINIHPALIPSFCGKGFYGDRVHKAVIEKGVKITGVTVHYVDEIYDHGRIIFQAPVFVSASDNVETLADKIHMTEHIIFPRIVKGICDGKITMDDGIFYMNKQFEQNLITDLARTCVETL